MTILVIIQTIALWVILGCFIAYKRKWYVNETNEEEVIFICATIICSPIALLIALFREFIIKDWDNS